MYMSFRIAEAVEAEVFAGIRGLYGADMRVQGIEMFFPWQEGAPYRETYTMKYFLLGQGCERGGELRVKTEGITFRRFCEPRSLWFDLYNVYIAGK